MSETKALHDCEEGSQMVKRRRLTDTRGHVLVEDPPIAVALFGSTKFAWLWLIARLWVGYQWLNSGFGVNYFLGLGGRTVEIDYSGAIKGNGGDCATCHL